MIIPVLGVALALMPQKSAPPTLRPIAQKLGMNLSMAVQSSLVQQNADQGGYTNAILKNCTMIGPENDLKPPALWLGIGQIDFSNSDPLINWAVSNNLKVRGHVLVYADDGGYTIPQWLLNMENSITPAQAKDILRDYIHAVVGRYSGKIFAWDVINEAIEDGQNSNPFNLRNSFWFRKLGKEFILYAFQFAHEADPACKLYYNDYNIEGGGSKADHVFEIVNYLKANGVAINGIGLQYHHGSGYKPVPGDGYYNMMTRIQQNNLKFMMTELDLSIPVVQLPQSDPNFGLIPIDPTDLTRQADSYGAYVKMALSFNNCEGIQMWGVNDSHSWIPYFTGGNRGAALILNKTYQQKPAYNAFYKAMVDRLKSR
jgi:endo-1,4-beta-xylanase